MTDPLPPLPFTQPFAVGDRITDTYSHWPIEATVTELTPRGFKYVYDHPVPFGRAQWGQQAIGGEVYLDMPESVYHLKQWAKSEPRPPVEFRTEYMCSFIEHP